MVNIIEDFEEEAPEATKKKVTPKENCPYCNQLRTKNHQDNCAKNPKNIKEEKISDDIQQQLNNLQADLILMKSQFDSAKLELQELKNISSDKFDPKMIPNSIIKALENILQSFSSQYRKKSDAKLLVGRQIEEFFNLKQQIFI